LEIIHAEDSSLLEKFGGHAMAAGVSIREAQFDKFKQLFQKIIATNIPFHVFENIIYTDGGLDPGDFHIDLAKEVIHGGPWGQLFPEPCFDNVFTIKQAYYIKDKHIKFILGIEEKVLAGIYFNAPLFNIGDLIDQKVRVIYTLGVNRYNNQELLQLKIQQLELLLNIA
jgi:single-stranded-DNA-specific exonuclease